VTLAQQQRQVGLIWSAMLSSVFIYGLICAAAAGTANVGADVEEWPRQLCSAAGVVLGGLSLWWRRRFLSPDPLPPVALKFRQLQGHGVVTWALSEAVGVCGVLAAFVLHDAHEYIPFGAAAVALLLLHRPSNLPWARLAS
jgi:F0F1-type ATP synthase membrane subunit c/vacuolar-type H+-ATPase subunit K